MSLFEQRCSYLVTRPILGAIFHFSLATGPHFRSRFWPVALYVCVRVYPTSEEVAWNSAEPPATPLLTVRAAARAA